MTKARVSGDRRRRASALAITACMSCSAADKTIAYDPYPASAEPAFPNRRAKLPAPKGRFAYVSDNGSDTVTVLDLPSNEVVASVKVGRDPLGIDGPHHLAVDRAGNVFVALQYPAPTTLPGPHAAHASAVRPGFVVKLAADDLRIVGEVQIDANPGEIVMSPDGTRLAATHFDLARASEPTLDAEGRKATVALLTPDAIVAVGSLPPVRTRVCRAPHGATFSADSRTLYMACYADDALAIVDVNNPAAPARIVPTSTKGPYSAILSPTGRWVAVGSTDSKDTRLFDTARGAFSDRVFVTLGAPFFAGWGADDSKVWIPTQQPDALVVVDVATGSVVRQRVFDVASCERPHEAVVSAADNTVYLVCEGDHVKPGAVLALDATTLETRATMPVGVYPDRLAWRPL